MRLSAAKKAEAEKWFNPTKGYGFIQPSGGDGCKDVFVHISAVERAGLSSLNERQAVEFEIEKGLEESMAGSDPVSVTQPAPLSADKRTIATEKK